MAKGFLSLVLFASLLGLVCCCDDGWMEYGGRCYIVVMVSANWYEAHDICQDNSAELTSIRDQAENDWILTQITDTAGIWIGLSEMNQGEYKWTDGSSLSWTNWGEGEPNDANGLEECVQMNPSNGLWNDDNCNQVFHFVCKEREGSQSAATLAPLISGVCPDGFMSEDFSNKCFRLEGRDGYKSFDDARSDCKNMNAELASITSATEQSFVLLLIEDSDTDVWIGLHRLYSVFAWVDNSQLDYTNYAPADIATLEEDCYSMDRSTNNLGTWKLTDCDSQMMYLCQADREESSDSDPHPFAAQYEDAKCADDYFLYHGQCFKFFDDSQTWDAAGEVCGRENAQLAVPFDLFEVARLTYESIDTRYSQKSWIGIKYEKETGEYFWGEGYRVGTTFFDDDEPDLQAYTSCVTVYEGAWYDEYCADPFPFFCMYSADERPTISSSSGGGCPSSDHTLYNDYCYWTSPDGGYQWYDALENCRSLGMELVSIHSKEENTFVDQLTETVRGDTITWMGLVRATNGDFRWTDGTPYDVTNLWDDGEPNNNLEECGMMQSDGTWNDIWCTNSMGYTCKTPKAPGLSSGAVAAIVIFVLVLVFVLAAAAFLTLTGRWSVVTDRIPNWSGGLDNKAFQSSSYGRQKEGGDAI